MSEKTNKKVSRACNTCRLKRKKCDGLDPCFFCTETKIECSYSREPRRRGPPSGYLRYTETKVNLLEILLGLAVKSATTSTQCAGAFVEYANTLRAETKTCTQDVWDAHKTAWIASEAAKIIEELTISFAPFVHRSDQETKPLLPPLNTNVTSSTPPPSTSLSPDKSTSEPPSLWDSRPVSHTSALAPIPSISLAFPLQPPYMLARESFERTRSTSTSDVPPSSFTSSPGRTPNTPLQAQTPRPNRGNQKLIAQLPPTVTLPEELGDYSENFVFPDGSNPGSSSVLYPMQPPANIDHGQSLREDRDISMLDDDVDRIDYVLHEDLDVPSGGYTGSYWRAADLALSEVSPFPSQQTLPPRGEIDLPPPHIVSHLLDIYFHYVHSSFPVLASRYLPQSSSTLSPSSPAAGLLLALCAYCGRFSPSLDNNSPSTNGFGFESGAGDVGKIAADLWYEQARTIVNGSLRTGSKIETMQALLFLALRDHGKGNEGQAWLLVGMAVRMGQDLNLHDDKQTKGSDSTSEQGSRENVWGVALTLDLFLSLQLGRPPIIADSLRNIPSSTNAALYTIDTTMAMPGGPIPSHSVFVYAVLLCQIISRINFFLYLGFGPTTQESRSEKLTAIKTELDMWHQALPLQFRISIGHQPEKDVLEVNMLYHVAIILLYRPFSKDNTSRAAEVFLDAASTFNVLLEKYRSLPSKATSGTSLTFSNPNMIYLIFTAAIAHLSGYKFRQQQPIIVQQQAESSARATTMTMQTQLHLLNCLETLAALGRTWELARRCWRTLDRLMEVEGLKPRSHTGLTQLGTGADDAQGLGKRKRGGEESRDSRGGNLEANESGIRQRSDGLVLAAITTPTHRPFEAITASPPNLPSLPVQSTSTNTLFDFSSSYLPFSPSTSSWNTNPTSGPNPSYPESTLYPPPIPPTTNFLDAEMFSTCWTPEVFDSDPMGLGMVWDGEWDEGSWRQSLSLNFPEIG